MVKALDAGPVILQVRTPIPDDETYGELQLRLSEMGALALIEALALIDLGAAVEQPQDDAKATYASKVDRGTTRVDWRADARNVSRGIRAYDPKPGAWAQANGADVKLFGARLSPRPSSAPPGEVLEISGDGMIVACGSGAVQIAAVQPAGKKRLAPADWARGRGVTVGQRLS
jgi:methionyl-tRNA formyltransferase